MLKQSTTPADIETEEPSARAGPLADAVIEDKKLQHQELNQDPVVEQQDHPSEKDPRDPAEGKVDETSPPVPPSQETTPTPTMTTATSPPPPPPETEQLGQQQQLQQHSATADGPGVAVKEEQPESTSTMTSSDEDLGSRLICAVCDGVVSSQPALAAHIQDLGLNHIGGDDVQGYACRVCRIVCPAADELDRHQQSRHPDDQVFKCSVCALSFRTNGGLTRHARKHVEDHVDLLRQGQTAAKRRSAEDADYEVEAKRRSPSSAGSDEDAAVPSTPATLAPLVPRFTCPVCPASQPFRAQYLPELEAHLEHSHRDYSVSCDLCGGSFRNVRDLNLHVHATHRSGGKGGRARDVLGFKDLTFVDFSSQKFAQIARVECEKSLHRAASRLHPFQCECGLAFPIDSALAIHRQACPNRVYVDAPADLSRGGLVLARRGGAGPLLEPHRGDQAPPRAASPKGDFFAKLDLLNNAASPSPAALVAAAQQQPYLDRDLADIQSILSVSASSGVGLGQDHGEEHEEQQDAFAAEFRRMKQRGEFPCRLCPEVFPNLRALKGHNRAHMAAPGADGYRCNMCPHAALDKVALQRHMRTHNGARPYECALCRFAFTTKANCERHLRNRHNKCSRDDVKSSIIYHPSEDPGNDPDQQQPLQPHMKLDVKRSLFAEPTEHMMLMDDEAHRRRSLDVGTMTSEDEREEAVADEAVEEAVDEHTDEQGRQSPLDLSMVLDLSKKRPPSPEDEAQDQDELMQQDEEEEVDEDDQPQDLSRKSASDSCSVSGGTLPLHLNTQPSPLQSPEPAAAPALPFPALGSLYVNPYQLTPGQGMAATLPAGLRAAGLPALPAGLPSSLPFAAAYYPGLLRSLQLGQLGQVVLEPMRLLQRPPFLPTAGPVVDNPVVPDVKDEHGVEPCPAASPKSERSSASDSQSLPPQPQVLSSGSSCSSGSSSSKMVMKNGVLMPKQKQRRYRTERPFVCEHCDARFTLSSNRERHIKHQHPQFWSQRHRGPSNGTPTGTPTLSAHMSGTPPSTPVPATPMDASTPLRASSPCTPCDRKQHHDEDDEDEGLVIDEERTSSEDHHADDDGAEGDAEDEGHHAKARSAVPATPAATPAAAGEDLASVSRLLDNASIQTFRQFLRDGDEHHVNALPHPVTPSAPVVREAPVPEECPASEEDMDEEGLVAGSPDEGNNSGSEQDKSESESAAVPQKKRSAYSLAPNRVCCPYCSRKFPWTSSLRRHVLTHTGQKPYKCTFCPLLFTTKSNCDRHLARKHSNKKDANSSGSSTSSGVSSNTTPNSSTSSASPASSASGGSPPEPLGVRASALSPQGLQGQGLHGLHGLQGLTLRAYKCRLCPSASFASHSTLRKHVSSKHPGSLESCILSGEELGRTSLGGASLSGYESHGSVSDVEHADERLDDKEDKKVEMKMPLFCPNLEQPLSLCKVERIDMDDKVEVKKEEVALNLHRSSDTDRTGADIMRESHNSLMSAANTAVPISAPVVSIPEGSVRPTESSVILSSSELPFKCHLCDGSFTERQECLEHIRLNHSSEYDILLSKGALELSNTTSPEDNNNGMDENHHADGENIEHIRGKFPDYANRKVMCAFCMRRFWSAEDLRRHMRTHTGERPFQCDVCRRRFTLKHSMLRHRKKHNDPSNNNNVSPQDLSPSAASGDEDAFPVPLKHIPSHAELLRHHVSLTNHNNNNINLAGVKKRLMAIDNQINLKRNFGRNSEEDSGLISNLLGIGDPSIIDKVLLTKSADDAEKLLGVIKNGNRGSNGRT